MNFKKRRKRPEEQIYIDFVTEFLLRFKKHQEFLFRFEHGGYRISKIEQAIRKKTLLKGGISDYGLFVVAGQYTMLWIEFKVGSNDLTPNQKRVRPIMEAWGAKCVTCWSAEEGILAVKKYLCC